MLMLSLVAPPTLCTLELSTLKVAPPTFEVELARKLEGSDELEELELWLRLSG